MTTPRKVVHLSTVHDATDVRVFHKECRSLAAAGYEVVLIANADGDRVVDGVQIRAIPVSTRNRFLRMTGTVGRVLQMAWRERADLYHVHSVEFLPAALLLRVLGRRVVYDAHENFSKVLLVRPYLPASLRAPVARVVGMFERLASRMVHGVVAATPSISEQFPDKKTVIINNFAIRSEFDEAHGQPHAERPHEMVYIGGLSEVRGLLQMIDATEIANQRTPSTLVLGGKYLPPSFRDKARHRPGWSHVRDLGWLSREEVAGALSRARIGMLMLLPTPNHIDSNPNKLFEYMAAGLPMITSDFPYWKRFVTDIECGIMVDPHDPEAIAEAMNWMLDHPEEAERMGQRGRQAFEERFTWEREAQRLIEFYETRIFAEPRRR